MIAIARLLWVSLLVLVPLTTRTPASGLAGSGRLASYLWTDLGLACLVGVVLLGDVFGGQYGRGRAREGQVLPVLFLALFEVQYVTLLVAVLRGDPMSVSYLGAGLVWLRALAVFMVARRLIEGLRDVRWAWHAFLAAFAAVCVIGLLELAGNAWVTALLNTHYGTTMHQEAARHLADIGQYRVTATFDRNPHGLALYMLMGISLITGALVSVRGMRVGPRLMLFALLGTGVLLLLVTSSLLAFLGTVASVATIVVARRRHRLRWAVVVAVALIAVGFAASSQLRTTVPRVTNAAVALWSGDLSSVALVSFTDRLDVWTMAIALMGHTPMAPVFGVGPAVLVRAVSDAAIYADNDYLFVLFTTGALGLAVFVAMLGACLLVAQRLVRSCPADDGQRLALFVGARGAVAGLAVAAIGGPFFTGEAFSRDSYMLWTLVGIACAAGVRSGPPAPAAEAGGQPAGSTGIRAP
jgi:O-antigen ligase